MKVNDYLEWEPINISSLTTTFIFNVSGSNLDDDERSMLTNILSDHIPTIKIKADIFESLNTIYSSILKKHLNSERLISDTAISYRYNNNNYAFTNSIKNFTLHNDTAKGLEVFFDFGIDGEIDECTEDKIDFSPKYMGVQEWYSLKSLKAAFITALGKGLFTVKLDKKWEGQAFQFYIGDLANGVPFANNFASDLPIEVNCKWSGEKNFKFRSHSLNHEIYTSVEVECIINFQGKQIIFTEFDLTLVIDVIALDDSLRFKVTDTGIFSPKYKSLDPNYIVEQGQYLDYAIENVVKTIRGSYVFGTGWKVSNRKFPSVSVTEDYLIIYDPSEK